MPQKIEPLADFARVILEVMEHEPEWNADLVDRIAREAFDRGLARMDHDGRFIAMDRAFAAHQAIAAAAPDLLAALQQIARIGGITAETAIAHNAIAKAKGKL